MNINLEELGDRLALNCMAIQNADITEFKALLDNSLNKICEMFFKKHIDAESQRTIRSVVNVYKRRCLEEFRKQHKLAPCPI